MPDAADLDIQQRRLEARARQQPRVHSRGPEKLAPLLRLLERLGSPHRTGRVVHVAGTNGKGTTAAVVAGLLQAAGLRTGLYTSPHLVHLAERFRVDGRPLPAARLARHIARVLDTAGRMPEGEAPGYFDLLTAVAFCAFHELDLDWWVLETGLGGLADATNVTGKRLCILTPIGRDHEAVLGGTLEAIAEQKLGIAVPGVPTVLAPQRPELQSWMERRLAARGVPCLPGDRVRIAPAGDPPDQVTVTWPGAPPVCLQLPSRRATRPLLSAAGVGLTAAGALLGEPAGVAERTGRAVTALSTVAPGRLQWVAGARWPGPPQTRFAHMVLDGAHNPDALAALADQIEAWGLRDYTLLVSLLADKLTDAVRPPLGRLLRPAHRAVAVRLDEPRAPHPDALVRFLEAAAPEGPPVHALPPREALAEVAREPERPVVAAGSLWMVGALLAELRLPAPAGAAVCPPGAGAGEGGAAP